MPADGDAGSYQADLQAVAAKSPLGPFDSTAVSIQERFPGESGRRLQDLVWMTYVIEEGASAMLFTQKSQMKTFVRHSLNDRDEHDTRKIYTGLLLKHGWLKSVRGAPWGIAEKTKTGDVEETRYHLISSATLVEAAYAAIELEPSNPQVQQLQAVPVENVVIFNSKTPMDVLEYLKDLANLLNGTGSKTSFIERLRLVPTIESKWLEEKQVNGIKARDSNYNAKLSAFLQKYWPGKFDSARDFSKANSLYSCLTNQGLWESFERYMNQHVVFTTPGLSAHSVYAACGAIAKSLLSDKAPDAWKIVAFHAFKFAVPTDDSIPWSLEGGDEKSMGKFFLLLTPMSESAVFQPSKKPKTAEKEDEAEECEIDEPEAGSKKRKGRAKGKAKAKAKAKGVPDVPDTESFHDVTSDGRTTLLIDDIINAICYATQDIPEGRKDEAVISKAYIQCLSFVFEKSLHPDGVKQPMKTWTKVRAWVKGELTKRHALRMRPSDPDASALAALTAQSAEQPDQSAGTTASAAVVEKPIDDDDKDSFGARSAETLEFLKKNPKATQKIASFVANNSLDDSVQDHVACAKMQVHFRKKLKALVNNSDAHNQIPEQDAFISTVVRLLGEAVHADGNLEEDVLTLCTLIVVASESDAGKGIDDFDEVFAMLQKPADNDSMSKREVRTEIALGTPAVGPKRAVLAPLYSSVPTLKGVVTMLGLRYLYICQCLPVIEEVLRPAIATWTTSSENSGDGDDRSKFVEILKASLNDFNLLRRFLQQVSTDVELMDAGCLSLKSWQVMWCRLVTGVRSLADKNFKVRTRQQWDQLKAESQTRFMKKKLEELKALARPLMIKAEHVAFQGKSPQKHCVGDLQLQDGQTQVVPVDEQVAAEVDAQLANSKKEPLAEILANDHVSKAKKEEDEIQHGMGHIIAEIAESARALSISSAKALACVDSESLASSIQQSIAQSLEPNMEYDLKKVCQTLGGESASTQCLTWHCLEQANCLQTICSQRRKRCFESLMQDVHDDHSLDLVDEGLEHIKCFTSGKPGSLKGKLFFTSEDKLGVHEQGRTLPSNLPKIKLWFAGKVATVLKSTVENGGGVKNRILLDLTSSVDDDSVSKWALSMTPLPGMLVLQSPLYLPSWNVRVLKPKEGQLQETPSLIPRKVVRVLPLGGDASYKGELVYLEWNTEYHFKDMSQVELTRAPFREEILEKKSTDGDQTLSKADAAMQLLLKGEEDDFQPIEPGELVAPKVNARLLKHLMN